METLNLITNVPTSDTAFTGLQSDWARFLPDPTMLDVSLYFARQVYAVRRQQQGVQLAVDAYKGRALQSVRQRISGGSNSLSDSLIAAILLLTVLNVRIATIIEASFACITDGVVLTSKP